MNEFLRRKWFHNGYGGSLQSGRDPVSTPACSCKGWASHQSQVVWLASQGFRLHKNGKVSEQGGGEGRRHGGQKGGLRVHLLQGHEVYFFPTLCSLVRFWDMKSLLQEHLACAPFFFNTFVIANFQPTRHVSADVVRLWCQQHRDNCKVNNLRTKILFSSYRFQSYIELCFQGPYADNTKEIRWIKISDMNIWK